MNIRSLAILAVAFAVLILAGLASTPARADLASEAMATLTAAIEDCDLPEVVVWNALAPGQRNCVQHAKKQAVAACGAVTPGGKKFTVGGIPQDQAACLKQFAGDISNDFLKMMRFATDPVDDLADEAIGRLNRTVRILAFPTR